MLMLTSPFVGSFIALLGLRLPEGKPVVWGRSACPHCGHQLAVRDLVPILSWIANRARCRLCRGPISLYYPLVELAAMVVAGLSVVSFDGAQAWLSAGLGWSLLGLAITDWRAFILPDALTLPLVPIGLFQAWSIAGTNSVAALLDRGIGALSGFLIFWGLGWAYLRLRQRAGLGLGDAKLMAAAGAWLGWAALPWVVLLAGSAGLLGAVLANRDKGLPAADLAVPFGTYLAASIGVIWFLRPAVDFYGLGG